MKRPAYEETKARARLDAEKKARAWMRRNAHKLPPLSEGRESRLPKHEVALSEKVGMAPVEEQHVVYDERHRFVPMTGFSLPLDLKSVELAARVNHVMTFLTEAQRETLRAHYIEGLILREMARKGETRQSVHERVSWARKAFERAWLEHGEDPITITEEDY